MQYKILWVVSMALIGYQSLLGQDDCQKYKQAGINFLNRGNYSEANTNFWIAMSACSRSAPQEMESLIDLIKKTTQRQVDSLDTNIKRVKTLQVVAENARDSISKLKDKEQAARADAEKAWKEAENNYQLATELGTKAESLRLAMLSNIARLSNEKSEAVYLAFMAYQMAGEQDLQTVLQSFAESVMDSFSVASPPITGKVKQMMFLPDNRHIITLSDNNSLWLGSLLPDGIELENLSKSAEGVFAVKGSSTYAFMEGQPDGKLIIRGASGNIVKNMEAHAEPLKAVEISHNGQWILTAGRDGLAKLWTKEGDFIRSFPGHNANVYGVGFSFDDSRAFTRSSDGSIKIWNTADGQELNTLKDKDVYFYSAVFSPAENLLFTGGSEGSARIWDQKGSLVRTLEKQGGPLKELLFFDNGKKLLSRAADNAVVIYSLPGYSKIQLPHAAQIEGAKVEPGTNVIATWSADGVLKLWNAGGDLIFQVPSPDDRVAQVEFTNNGQFILSTYASGATKLWDTQGNYLLNIEAAAEGSQGISFSPDGKSFAWVTKQGNAVRVAPLYSTVLNELENKKSALTPRLEELNKKYELQFWGKSLQ